MKRRIFAISMVMVMILSMNGYGMKVTAAGSATSQGMIADRIFESGDWRYYIDEVDEGRIYRTNMAMTTVELVADVNACAFFIKDNWIYYIEALDASGTDGDICRIKIDGTGRTILYEGNGNGHYMAERLIYMDGRLYCTFNNYHSFFSSMKIDGSDFREEKENIRLETVTLEGKRIYSVAAYSDISVTCYDTVTQTQTEWTYEGGSEDALYYNGWVYMSYYEDRANSGIIRVNYASKEVELVTTQFYNMDDCVLEGDILYGNAEVNTSNNKEQTPGKYVIKIDTTSKKVEVAKKGKGYLIEPYSTGFQHATVDGLYSYELATGKVELINAAMPYGRMDQDDQGTIVFYSEGDVFKVTQNGVVNLTINHGPLNVGAIKADGHYIALELGKSDAYESRIYVLDSGKDQLMPIDYEMPEDSGTSGNPSELYDLDNGYVYYRDTLKNKLDNYLINLHRIPVTAKDASEAKLVRNFWDVYEVDGDDYKVYDDHKTVLYNLATDKKVTLLSDPIFKWIDDGNYLYTSSNADLYRRSLTSGQSKKVYNGGSLPSMGNNYAAILCSDDHALYVRINNPAFEGSSLYSMDTTSLKMTRIGPSIVSTSVYSAFGKLYMEPSYLFLWNDNGASEPIISSALKFGRLSDQRAEIVVETKEIADVEEGKFRDVKDNDWFAKLVYEMVDKKIVSGYNGDFSPYDTLKVNQFLKMVSLALEAEIEPSTGKWDQPYISYCLENNIIAPTDFLDYDREISRGEMAIILSGVLGETQLNSQEVEMIQSEIIDFADISDQYQSAVLHAYHEGLITGYPDGSFMVDNSLNRAEGVVVISRLISARSK